MPTTSPSRTKCSAGSAFTACTIEGKRELNERPLRENSATSLPLRTAIQRNPSNFGSNSHSRRAASGLRWRWTGRLDRLEPAWAAGTSAGARLRLTRRSSSMSAQRARSRRSSYSRSAAAASFITSSMVRPLFTERWRLSGNVLCRVGLVVVAFNHCPGLDPLGRSGSATNLRRVCSLRATQTRGRGFDSFSYGHGCARRSVRLR